MEIIKVKSIKTINPLDDKFKTNEQNEHAGKEARVGLNRGQVILRLLILPLVILKNSRLHQNTWGFFFKQEFK